MKAGIRLTLFIALCLCWSAAVSAAPILRLTEQALPNKELLGYIDIYEDRSRQLTISDVMDKETARLFAPASLSELSFGYTNSVYWVRLSLENASAELRHLMLSITPADIEHIELFAVDQQNQQVFHASRNGVSVPVSERDYRVGALLFDLDMDSGQTATIFLRASSSKSVNFRLFIDDQRNFIPGLLGSYYWQAALLWAMALTIVVACFCAVLLKQRSLWLLAGFCAAGLGIHTGLNGFILQEVALSPAWLNKHLHICANLMSAAMSGFVISAIFADRTRFRYVQRYLQVLLIGNLIGCLVALIAPATISSHYCTLAILLTNLSIFALALRAHLISLPFASVFLFTRSIHIIGLIVSIFNARGYMPTSLITEWGMALAITIEALLLTAATMYYSIRQSPQPYTATPIKLTQESFTNGRTPYLDLHDICHELRTPISGVLGMSDLLLGGSLTEQQRQQIRILQQAGQSLVEITDKLNAIANIRDGLIDVEQEHLDFHELLQQCTESAQQHRSLHQLEIILDIADGVPESIVSDPEKLSQVVSNILGLVLNHTEQGDVILSASMAASDRVLIEVNSQSGSSKERLFFNKNYITASDKLNLAIAESYTSLLNGKFNSPFNQTGALSFSCELPVIRSDYSRKTFDSLQSNLVGKRLLIVDDNVTCCTIIEKQAGTWGMIPYSATSGREALAKIRSYAELGEHFDVVLIDYDMPHMNGLELINHIVHEAPQSTHPLKIFLLTGMQRTIAAQSPALPIEKILFKPINSSSLKRYLIEVFL